MKQTVKLQTYSRKQVLATAIPYAIFIVVVCISFVRGQNIYLVLTLLILATLVNVIAYLVSTNNVTANIPLSKMTLLSKPDKLEFHMEDNKLNTFSFAGKEFTPEDVVLATLKINNEKTLITLTTKSGDFVTVKLTTNSGLRVWTANQIQYLGILVDQSSLPESKFEDILNSENYFEVGKRDALKFIRTP